MKSAVLVTALLLALGAGQASEIKPEPGTVLPAKVVPKQNHHLYMTHSAQLRPFIEREIAGIKYILAYDENTRVITYVYTADEKFETDGLRVGSYIEVDDEQTIACPGWEIRGPASKDGWQPLIGFNSEMTVRKGGKDVTIYLRTYRLPEEPVKAKISGFVKGGN